MMMTPNTEVRTIDWATYNPDNIVYEIVGNNTKNNFPIIRVEDRTLFSPGCPMKIHMFTPPLVTNFPKLGPDCVPTWSSNKADGTNEVNKQELDLSMKGAGSVQLDFKKWMDKFDDSLLTWMISNQRFLGKSSETKEAIKAMQKRAFRKRVSVKTGQEYPDSWTIRCPKFNPDGTPNFVPIFDGEGALLPWDAVAPSVKFNDVLMASVRYDGVFVRPGMFGHSWSLMAIKNFGTIISTVEESKKYLVQRPFPELNNEMDFPKLCVRD